VAASSLLTSTTINTTATINTWTSLNSSINAAAGKSTTLTLSAPCSGYTSAISINTAYTNVTIVGNGATFDGGGYHGNTWGGFFKVGEKALLAMSNVTLKNGYVQDYSDKGGGAVYVASGGTFTVTSSTFSGNSVFASATGGGQGGAVYVESGGTFTVTSSTFLGNSVYGWGGALYFYRATGLIKNCTFVGPISDTKNDIYNQGDIYNVTRGNVTFACADGEVGTPVQMQGAEIAVIPPKELKCTAQLTYACYNGGKANWKCVPDPTSTATLAQCHEVCAP
jgi:hypothetical protein